MGVGHGYGEASGDRHYSSRTREGEEEEETARLSVCCFFVASWTSSLLAL